MAYEIFQVALKSIVSVGSLIGYYLVYDKWSKENKPSVTFNFEKEHDFDMGSLIMMIRNPSKDPMLVSDIIIDNDRVRWYKDSSIQSVLAGTLSSPRHFVVGGEDSVRLKLALSEDGAEGCEKVIVSVVWGFVGRKSWIQRPATAKTTIGEFRRLLAAR